MKREASKFLLPNHALTGLPSVSGSGSGIGYTKPASAPAAMMASHSSSLDSRHAINTPNNINNSSYRYTAPTISTAIDSNSNDQGIALTISSSNSNKASSLLPLNRVLRNEHTLSVVHMDVVPQHAKTSSRRLHSRHHHNRHHHQPQQGAIASSSDSIIGDTGGGGGMGEGDGSDDGDSSEEEDSDSDEDEGDGSVVRVQPLLAHIWPDNTNNNTGTTTHIDNTTNSTSKSTHNSTDTNTTNSKVTRSVKRDNFLSTPSSNMVRTSYIAHTWQITPEPFLICICN